MNPSAKQILTRIEQYLNEYPNHRFAQALFNLKINEFGGNNTKPGGGPYLLRDCYYDSDTMVLKRMGEQFIPSYKVHRILIVLAAENNEEAKFLFSNPETTLKELEEYNWLKKTDITNEKVVTFFNKIVNRKNNAVIHRDYEWAAYDRDDERRIIYTAAQLNGMADFILDAQRDFENVRCHLLLKEMEEGSGFEKKV